MQVFSKRTYAILWWWCWYLSGRHNKNHYGINRPRTYTGSIISRAHINKGNRRSGSGDRRRQIDQLPIMHAAVMVESNHAVGVTAPRHHAADTPEVTGFVCSISMESLIYRPSSPSILARSITHAMGHACSYTCATRAEWEGHSSWDPAKKPKSYSKIETAISICFSLRMSSNCRISKGRELCLAPQTSVTWAPRW